MAITENGVTKYEGAVIRIWEHYWLDGMTEEYATVWDIDAHETKMITIGYYGSDGRNLYGGIKAEVDVNLATVNDILRTVKNGEALRAFERSVLANKTAIKAGTKAEVVKGRKVKKGTILDVFWVGERETYQSRQYHWMHETERIAGCYDSEGNKVWIRAEYLKNVDPIKSPCASERRKFIKAFTKHYVEGMGIRLPNKYSESLQISA